MMIIMAFFIALERPGALAFNPKEYVALVEQNQKGNFGDMVKGPYRMIHEIPPPRGLTHESLRVAARNLAAMGCKSKGRSCFVPPAVSLMQQHEKHHLMSAENRHHQHEKQHESLSMTMMRREKEVTAVGGGAAGGHDSGFLPAPQQQDSDRLHHSVGSKLSGDGLVFSRPGEISFVVGAPEPWEGTQGDSAASALIQSSQTSQRLDDQGSLSSSFAEKQGGMQQQRAQQQSRAPDGAKAGFFLVLLMVVGGTCYWMWQGKQDEDDEKAEAKKKASAKKKIGKSASDVPPPPAPEDQPPDELEVMPKVRAPDEDHVAI